MDGTTKIEVQTDEPAVPWRSRTVQIVLTSTALAPLGVPLISPALPVFRDVFGISDAQASLLVSTYFVVGIVLSPFIGLLADRIGRKRVLVAGLATFGVLGGAMALAPSFEALLALRVAQGTAAAAIFITTVTLVGDTFDGAQRNAVLGVNVAVLSATAALFPVLGGMLVGIAWNAPFLAYLAALPVAAFAQVALDEPDRPAGGRGTAYLVDAARTVLTPPLVALFAVAFVTEFLAFGVIFTALPFLLATALTPVLIGAVILAGEASSMVVATASGRLARLLSNEWLIALGFACYAVGFAAAWIAPGTPAMLGAVLVIGAGVGLLMPVVDAAVSDRVDTEYLAGAMSLRNSTTFLGRTAGPIAFAGLAISVGYGYDSLLLASSLVAVLAALIAAGVGNVRLVRVVADRA
ncbi:MFS transporter [Halalkalicoccus sp. NIPERK01]|uniref:MFS transporter n=1 Tax=Halalkalicoccus sp. NIPERK01 TaxID=3053469 RepID=UPI00256F00DE|nr:MFS transporter [Halalkalicoccus sp. NIPERK01]MDL5360570.1 MFS transporter [Halalkalicoccus sp. NIPERK01]